MPLRGLVEGLRAYVVRRRATDVAAEEAEVVAHAVSALGAGTEDEARAAINALVAEGTVMRSEVLDGMVDGTQVLVLDKDRVVEDALADVILEASHSEYSPAEIEGFRAQLAEMEAKKGVLDGKAQTRMTAQIAAMVVGLAGYIGGVSWATVEIGWDVIEPMTYMVTVSTSIAAYSYFVFYKKNYTYQHLGNGMLARAKRRLYARHQFDHGAYEMVQWILSLDERRIRDPFSIPPRLSDAEHAIRQARFERVRDYIRAKERKEAAIAAAARPPEGDLATPKSA